MTMTEVQIQKNADKDTMKLKYQLTARRQV